MSRRHHSKLPKLNRSTKERKSLFKIQLRQLIELGKITTTVAKAKVIKRLFDKLAAKASNGTLASRRNVAAQLSSPKTANRLVDLIIPVMGGRRSGFTSIQKVGIRKGDATPTASLTLVAPIPAEPEKIKKAMPAGKQVVKEVLKKETKKVITKKTK